MSTDSKFAPRALTASEYVRELFGPEDNAAILVRKRSTGHTVQTISMKVRGGEFSTGIDNGPTPGLCYTKDIP